jgi:hypothetical protein
MARGAKHYPVPAHLNALGISQEDFGKWLDRATNAHVKRDRNRTSKSIKPVVYRQAIFRAVCDGGDLDYYTGEHLDWRLLSYFSKSDGSGRDQRLIPTIDHDGLNTEAPVFRICSLRTNKCKSDYSSEQMLEFCHAFITHQGRRTRVPLEIR